MPSLLIATNNHGKVLEIKDLLSGLGLTLLTPRVLDLDLHVLEDGSTYAENAVKKAIAFMQANGLTCLADDSGLEVEALDGKPGLHSNRFGPQPGTDVSRRRYLLDQLHGQPRPWKAAFHATVAIAHLGSEAEVVTGSCAGEIIPQERGTGGFGYDPLFLFPDLGRTMAELDMAEKNRLSHRARAVMNAISILKKIYNLE